MSVLLQPQNLVKLSRAVSRELGSVELTMEENMQLIKIVKKVDHNMINQYPLNTLINVIAKVAASKIKKNKLQPENKESLVAKVNYENIHDITQLFGISDKTTILRTLNPCALYDYNFIILSTSTSTTTADNPYIFQWQLMENDTLGTGIVNIKPMKNMVGIRIFPIKFVYSYPTIQPPGISDSLVNIQNAHYMLFIKELITQSILSYNNTRYHFLMTNTLLTYNSIRYIELAAKKENGYYWFHPPIISLSTITMTMRDNVGQTGFPLSYVQAIIEMTNPIRVNIPYCTLTLTTGMLCRFYNPTISNPTSAVNNTFINALTVGTGLPITMTTTNKGYVRFTIPIDGTVINPTDLPSVTYVSGTTTYVNVYIPSSTSTIIPLCIISLKP